MTKSGFLKMYVYLSSGAVLLLAFVILAGWHLGLQAVVQFRPGMVPMQHNTALAHFLCALALLTAGGAGRLRKISILAAFAALVLSGITGSQYITGWNLGIDTLFGDPYMGAGSHLQVKTAHPGRMAPNTVICFMLVSLGLLCWHFLEKKVAGPNAALVFAAPALALSLIALTGYLFGIEAAYGWWSLSDMALQTAAGFFLTGSGMAAFIFRHGQTEALKKSWLFARKPLLAATAGIMITLVIAQSVLEQGRRRVDDIARVESLRIASLIKHDLGAGIKALERMQARWRMQDGIPVEQWRQSAEHYMRDRAFYYAFALVGQDYEIRVSAAPETDDDFWKGIVLDRNALEKAGASGSPFFTRLKRGEERTPYLGHFLPLYTQAGFDGFLATAYSMQDGLDELFGIDTGDDYQYGLFDEDGLLATNFIPERAFSWEVLHEAEIPVYDERLKIRVAQDVSGHDNGGIVFLIFIAGIGMSLLLAGSMHQTNKIRFYTNRLEESEERYTLAVDGADIALWDWDLANGRVVWGGRAWKYFGAASNDDLPCDEKDVRAHIPSEDNEAIDKVIFRELAEGDNFTVEFRIRQPDGGYKWAQSRGKAVERREGKPVRTVGIFTEVTERKEYEAQLKRTNEELEQFAYIASHDLKAPLRGIDNLTKWIEEDLLDVMTDDAREKLDLMRGRVSRLEALLEDILQYSRAGRIVDEPVEVDTKELAGQIAASLDLPKGFRVEIAEDLPVLTAPYTPLQQIFLNLISNAHKHHDKKKGLISVQAEDRGLFYEFCVADDGPGIPEEFHERVFKMFQTLKPRDKTEGSGLGMSIIKKLVGWQGGRVWIVSKDGQRGTEVRFLWPKHFVDVRRKDAA